MVIIGNVPRAIKRMAPSRFLLQSLKSVVSSCPNPCLPISCCFINMGLSGARKPMTAAPAGVSCDHEMWSVFQVLWCLWLWGGSESLLGTPTLMSQTTGSCKYSLCIYHLSDHLKSKNHRCTREHCSLGVQLRLFIWGPC